jgi:hypothetical protein
MIFDRNTISTIKGIVGNVKSYSRDDALEMLQHVIAYGMVLVSKKNQLKRIQMTFETGLLPRIFWKMPFQCYKTARRGL